MNHVNEAAGQPEGVQNSEFNAKCLANQISRGDMILEITQTIPTDETEAVEPPGKTIISYLAMLNDWAQE